MQTTDYDIVIVGNGVVGMTFACALAHTPLRIAILDHEVPAEEAFTSSYDLRVSAINLNSQQVFQQLNVWPMIAATCPSPFREIRVWDTLGQGAIHFSSQQLAEPQLGHIIEQRVMISALREHLATCEHVEILRPVHPHLLQITDNGVQLQLTNGQSLTAQLLVGADGAHSWVRQTAGIPLHGWSYHHKALVTTVHTELPHQETAWQCFWPDGPLALLPLADHHHCSIVWSTLPARAEQLLSMTDDDFNKTLTATFQQRLGQLRKIDRLLDFPLHMRHVKQYVKPHLALIGDAAHTLHPLAGQGVNLGIADACSLAKGIDKALQKGRAINDWQTLRHYERSRKGDNWKMIAFVELFKRLFASRLPLAIHARAVGLNFTDRQTLLKAFFVKQATGRDNK
ncbi:MAG: UbiH/UbiF/VisC/COQ6 family ubiquinone biosynthesis hydroxylase [Gammaproteobacteria bacterium]